MRYHDQHKTNTVNVRRLELIVSDVFSPRCRLYTVTEYPVMNRHGN